MDNSFFMKNFVIFFHLLLTSILLTQQIDQKIPKNKPLATQIERLHSTTIHSLIDL